MHAHPKHLMRHAMVDQARLLVRQPLSPPGTVVISARNRQHMLITPRQVPFSTLAYRQLLRVSLKHFRPEWKGEGQPPSSWHTHRAILRNMHEANVVLQFQGCYVTALAMARQGIPGWHQGIRAFGGHNVPCTPSTPLGSPVLSVHVLRVLEDRQACLLGGLGGLVIGPDLAMAVARARELERQAMLHWLARQTVMTQRFGRIERALAGCDSGVQKR